MKNTQQSQQLPSEVSTSLLRVSQGNATEQDQQILKDWYASFDDQKIIIPTASIEEEHVIDQRLRDRLNFLVRQDKKQKARWWVRYAAIFFLVGSAILGWYINRPGMEEASGIDSGLSDTETLPAEILPGGNRAILMLADGTKIELRQDQGQIIIGNNEITYQDGSLVQGFLGAVPEDHNTANRVSHSISTPRGGQYLVHLPDGTQVWLNSESTLTYPAQFAENSREVELEGEAFFDVKSFDRGGTRIPFVVVTNNQKIHVLGTEFNVMAYPEDKEARTTLVDGLVQVSLRNGSNLTSMRPGEQVVFLQGKMEKKKVDVSSYVAWKDNQFMFDHEPLESILKKVSRWYDVDVVFEEDYLRGQLISGSVSRYGLASEVLEILSLTELANFEIKGRTILVRPPVYGENKQFN